MQRVELKCKVAGGHYISELERHVNYGDTVVVDQRQLEDSNDIQSAIVNGSLVVENRTSYEESDDGSYVSGPEPTNTDEDEEGQSDDVEQPSVDMSNIEDLLEQQLHMLSRIEDQLKEQPAQPNVDLSGLVGKIEREPATESTRESPEYVPSEIRTGEAEVSNLTDTDESESSSGSIDEAAELLESFDSEDNDE